jgi:hypothetical protein
MKKLLLIFCLLASVATAGVLDTNAKARIEVFKLLAMDTTGTSNLSTGIVDNFIYAGLERVCEDLSAKERVKKITLLKNYRHYLIDTSSGYDVINLRACLWIDGDSVVPLTPLDIDASPNVVWEQVNTAGLDRPGYFYRWGDSVGFIPMPAATDTVLVFYNTTVTPSSTSMAEVPIDYRWGAVYWAAYLSAVRIGIDPAPYLSLYQQFVVTKKPVIGVQK